MRPSSGFPPEFDPVIVTHLPQTPLNEPSAIPVSFTLPGNQSTLTLYPVHIEEIVKTSPAQNVGAIFRVRVLNGSAPVTLSFPGPHQLQIDYLQRDAADKNWTVVYSTYAGDAATINLTAQQEYTLDVPIPGNVEGGMLVPTRVRVTIFLKQRNVTSNPCCSL